MRVHTSPLDYVRVAAPCPADWGRMAGDERVRFCGQCNLNVYNLSGMSKREAESFVTRAEGRVCVRFYRRADGTILTKNCPVGLAALRRRAGRVANATISAVLGFFAGLGLNTTLSPRRHVMGAMAVPSPVTTTGALPVETPDVTTDVSPPPVKGQLELVAGEMSYADLVPSTTETRGRLQMERVERPRGKRPARR